MSTTVVLVISVIVAGLVFGTAGLILGHKYASLHQTCDNGECLRAEEGSYQPEAVPLSHMKIKEQALASLHKRPHRSPAELESSHAPPISAQPPQNFL